jgi:hypothetical protein
MNWKYTNFLLDYKYQIRVSYSIILISDMCSYWVNKLSEVKLYINNNTLVSG